MILIKEGEQIFMGHNRLASLAPINVLTLHPTGEIFWVDHRDNWFILSREKVDWYSEASGILPSGVPNDVKLAYLLSKG